MLKPIHTLTLAWMLGALPLMTLAQDFYRAGEKVVPRPETHVEEPADDSIFEEEEQPQEEPVQDEVEPVEDIAEKETPEQQEVLEEPEVTEEESLQPAAPESITSILMRSMQYVITIVAIIVAGVAYLLFGRKKKVAVATQEVVEKPNGNGVAQSSNRLEQALDAMEDESSK